MFEFGVIMDLGKASRMQDRAVVAAARMWWVVVVFFGNVNQVLVRLWARVIDIRCVRWMKVPLSDRLV